MTPNAPQEKRVFVTRRIAEPALEQLRTAAEVEVGPGQMPPPHAELVARLNQIDGVLSMVSDRLDAETIAGAPRLLVISNLAVGVDNIDLAAATHAGIPVGHTPGVLTETTPHFTFPPLIAPSPPLP